MTDYSLNETAKLALLAAKGAGYSWGMAEEVSYSVRWLVQRGLPGPKMLTTLLSYHTTPESLNASMPTITGNNFSSKHTGLCPVASGCAISDAYLTLDWKVPIVLSELKCPLLILPFMVQIASQHSTVIILEFDNSTIDTDGKHIRFANTAPITLVSATSVTCRAASSVACAFKETDIPTLNDRVLVDQQDWEALAAHAHKTYAPATERSRELGAGSGLNDND